VNPTLNSGTLNIGKHGPDPFLSIILGVVFTAVGTALCTQDI